MPTFRDNFPPKPQFTENSISSQAGKVFLVTGCSSGVGKELAKILYSHNAKVYITARSTKKVEAAIADIKAAHPQSQGELIYLQLDLNDLSSVKKSADEFLRLESRLDVLWNNAGVMLSPTGTKTKQGYEEQLGVNCLATFLFTQLLTPLLISTAKTAAAGSVRVIWVSSSATHRSPPGGIDFNNLDYKKDIGKWAKYGTSKAGLYYYATQYAKLHQNDSIVSLSLHPGNLKTELQRNVSSLQMVVINMMVYPPINGAYTELFAGLSPEVTLEKSGAWIQPWGRFSSQRPDLVEGSKSKAEGGTGIAEKFWDWSEEQVKSFM
ncbi:short chain dehydrogenase reductase [Trichoderma velutinum]